MLKEPMLSIFEGMAARKTRKPADSPHDRNHQTPAQEKLGSIEDRAEEREDLEGVRQDRRGYSADQESVASGSDSEGASSAARHVENDSQRNHTASSSVDHASPSHDEADPNPQMAAMQRSIDDLNDMMQELLSEKAQAAVLHTGPQTVEKAMLYDRTRASGNDAPRDPDSKDSTKVGSEPSQTSRRRLPRRSTRRPPERFTP